MPLRTPRTTAAIDAGDTTTRPPDRSAERWGVVETGNWVWSVASLVSSRRGLPRDGRIARWAQLVVGSLKPPSLLLHVGRPIELNKESSQK